LRFDISNAAFSLYAHQTISDFRSNTVGITKTSVATIFVNISCTILSGLIIQCFVNFVIHRFQECSLARLAAKNMIHPLEQSTDLLQPHDAGDIDGEPHKDASVKKYLG